MNTVTRRTIQLFGLVRPIARNFGAVRRPGMRIAVLIFALATGLSPAWAQGMLGVSLPATPASTITQGSSPNFADTYVTPFVASNAGTITAWKAQFTAGSLTTGCGLPVGIQLKVLRPTSANIVTVVSAGAVQNPKSILQARFGGACPSFGDGTPGSVIQFTESGLLLAAGDIIGLTIQSDPTVKGYFYPLVSAGNTRIVTRNVPVGGTIDLTSSFTGTLEGLAPALQTTGAPWMVGDVFVGVGNTRYQVYRVSGSPPTATLIDTITDGQARGFTTGCAIDSTYHLYTTNFTNTKVVKFATPPPHAVLQTIDANVTSPLGLSESIVFDGTGNFYVGHAGGNHLVHKYNAAGVLQQTFAVATDRVGSDWIDLASDQKTLFYTSEGRRIKRFDVSTGKQLLDFVNLGETAGTLFALRLLPPGDGSGGLLVADSANIKRLNSSGNVIQAYSVPGENNWFALNLDPNGTSFWAGDFGTGHFYRFNISSGAIELGPINTRTLVSGVTTTGLFGICVYGGFSAAQPAPKVQILNLTPTNNSGTVLNDNNSNEFSVTLNGLSQPTKVTIRFSEIDQSAGTSDTGLPCIKVSFDGKKCAVHQVEADTTAYTLAHLYHGWVIKGTKNPRMIKNESLDITTAQVIEPGVCGDTFPMSTYTANELPLPKGAINCGFFPPVQDGAVFNLGRTIPLRFEATTGTCHSGPFITAASGAQPRLSLAKVVPGFPPVPQLVMASGASNVSNLFRIGDGKVWTYDASTKHLTAGDYIVTVFDLTNHIPPAFARISLR